MFFLRAVYVGDICYFTCSILERKNWRTYIKQNIVRGYFLVYDL